MNRQDDNDNLLDRAASAMVDAPEAGDFPEQEVLQSVRLATSPVTEQKLQQPPIPSLLRRLGDVKPLAKIAASILIACSLVAVAWAMFHARPALAFASVAQRLHDAQTMSADISIQQDVVAMNGRLLFAAPGRFRVEFAGIPAEIVDMETGRIVLIDHANKSAVVMRVGEKDAPPAAVSFDWIEQLRNISHTAGKPVGEADVNGTRAQEFNVMQDGQPFTIWADAKTGAPLRIQSKLKLGNDEVKITLDHLTLGLPMNDALFSTVVPAGYSQQQANVSAAIPAENDLITFFKDYTTRTGIFPPSLKDFDKTLNVIIPKGNSKSSPATTQSFPSGDFMGIMLQAGRVMMFLSQLPPTADWHYAGADVKPSIPDAVYKPIFWYHAGSTNTWRIIYADFHATDASGAVTTNPAAESQSDK